MRGKLRILSNDDVAGVSNKSKVTNAWDRRAADSEGCLTGIHGWLSIGMMEWGY